MKERPIIFSTELIPKILDGSKTQTRRVIKPQPPPWAGKGTLNKFGRWDFGGHTATRHQISCGYKCPYGQVGDRLWVREKALYWDGGAGGISAVVYADDPEIPELLKDNERLFVARTCSNAVYGHGTVGKWMWKPSIHMYRCDSRITLEITNIRVERLWGVKIDDWRWEGMTYMDYLAEGLLPDKPEDRYYCHNPRGGCGCSESPLGELIDKFRQLWDSLNPKYSWEANPWVWVIGFKNCPK